MWGKKVHYHNMGYDPTTDEIDHPQPLISCGQLVMGVSTVIVISVAVGFIAANINQPQQVNAMPTLAAEFESLVLSAPERTLEPEVSQTVDALASATMTPTMTQTPAPTRTAVPVMVTRVVEVEVTRQVPVTRVVEITSVPRVEIERVIITSVPQVQQIVITQPAPPPQVFVTQQTVQIIATQWMVVTATTTPSSTPSSTPTMTETPQPTATITPEEPTHEPESTETN